MSSENDGQVPVIVPYRPLGPQDYAQNSQDPLPIIPVSRQVNQLTNADYAPAAAQQEVQAAQANPGGIPPPTSSPWSFSDILVTGLGFAFMVAAIIYLLVEHPGSSSDKKAASSTALTSAQAAQAQQLIQRQLASADQTLAKAGYSAEHIAQAHNETAITDGSQIAFSVSTPVDSYSLPKKVVVSGNEAPNHYAALDSVNAKQYIATLSAAPSLSDLTENSAVIHDAKASDR